MRSFKVSAAIGIALLGAATPGALAQSQFDSQFNPWGKPADLKEASMWGATPIDQLWCRINFHRYRYEGQFTPDSTGASS